MTSYYNIGEGKSTLKGGRNLRVFVKNLRGQALMPCSNKKARILLKEGKAKVLQYTPFTIQLLYPTGETFQKIDIGVDTGAISIGLAVVSMDKVLAKGEIELRDGIHKDMITRSQRRKARRVKNTRYRKKRFLNRKRKDDWLPPTINSKLNATYKWIDIFSLLVPIPNLHIEVCKFNIKKMVNEENIEKNSEYDNVRLFVFARDNYTCQVCKKKNKIYQTHHIKFRSKGGTDRASNLITVCTDCHTAANHNEGGILYDWMIKNKNVKSYREAYFMNIIKKHILKRYTNADITYGYETSKHRRNLKLDKTHYNDAIAITKIEDIKENSDSSFYIKQFRKKKRSLHESYPIKFRKNKNVNASRKNKNVPERFGWFMNDMVSFNGKKGWIYGFSGGETGHSCIVRDIFYNIIKVDETKSTPQINFSKLCFVCHNNNWQYTLL